MILQIVADDDFIADSIVKAMLAQQTEKEAFSNTIEFGMGELVRIYMRQIASEAGSPNRRDLLGTAFDRATEKLRSRLDPHRLKANIEKLRRSVFAALKHPAAEMSKLSESLVKSRVSRRIEGQELLTVNPDASYEITRIGLTDAIEGLLAQPLAVTVEIDLEALKSEYLVEGEWFPFQIQCGELFFILDDNGAIYTSTQNFPPSVFEDAYSRLKKLAGHVYGWRF